jgi:hypothetical protein
MPLGPPPSAEQDANCGLHLTIEMTVGCRAAHECVGPGHCALRRLHRAGNGPEPDTFPGAMNGDDRRRPTPDEGGPPPGGLLSLLGGAPSPRSPGGHAREGMREWHGGSGTAVLVAPELGNRTRCPRQHNGRAKCAVADVLATQTLGCRGRGIGSPGGVGRRTRRRRRIGCRGEMRTAGHAARCHHPDRHRNHENRTAHSHQTHRGPYGFREGGNLVRSGAPPDLGEGARRSRGCCRTDRTSAPAESRGVHPPAAYVRPALSFRCGCAAHRLVGLRDPLRDDGEIGELGRTREGLCHQFLGGLLPF